MVGSPHSGMLEIRAKTDRYGRWVVTQIAKTTGIPGRHRRFKNGGLAPAIEKCEFPREKRDRYGFDPLKRPGFLLKRSQSMLKRSETMRVEAQTGHKPTKAAARGVQ